MASIQVLVNGKEQIYSEAFLIADDQDVELNVRSMPVFFRFKVRFTAPEEKPSGNWTTTGSITQFIFRGWSNSVTSLMEEPQRIGEVNGRELYFQMAHRKVGRVNEVHWFVYMDAQS
jgi:hypothetical protein